MKSPVSFALLREGNSDDGLLSHLRELIIRAGASEAFGTSRPFRGSSSDKLSLFADEDDDVDLVFLHRDGDSAGYETRAREIENAAAEINLVIPVVPLIPVQELEAWLLLDEHAIRAVVGRPNGKVNLGLPKVKHVETTSQPKELLQAALVVASEATGRRLDREKRQFNQRRRALLERLDPDGPLQNLGAWCALRDAIQQVVPAIIDP